MPGYLLDHPNPHGEHFHRSRRGTVLAIVVHITAGLEDLDGVDDHSAEKTAAYCATTERAVSWHSGSDADSALDLLPATFTAWHAAGYNSRTYGHELSKTSPDWRSAPEAWVDATLRIAARHLAVKARELGIPVRKANRRELDEATARNLNPVGFIGHAELDPARRRDPGIVGATETFPWARFLELVAAYQRPASAPPPAPVVFNFPEENMKSTFLEVPHVGFGCGRAVWDPELGHAPVWVGATLHGPDPEAGDGWWLDKAGVQVRAQERGGKVVVTTTGSKSPTSTFVFVAAA